MSEENQDKKKKKKDGFFYTLMGGRLFASELVTKNVALFALIVLYSFIYVSSRYEYERELKEIDRLRHRKEMLKNNLLTQKSEFTSKTRQTEIEKMLREKGSDIERVTQPMYEIKK